MNKRTQNSTRSSKKRWGRYSDMVLRYSLGKGSCIKLAEKADAISRVGRTVLIDLEKVDRYLEAGGVHSTK